MKNLFFAVVLITAMGCKTTPEVTISVDALQFSEIIGKEWKLIEVHVDGTNINFNRYVLADEGFNELFTLTFDEETISGVGAPNRYSAPYTQEENQTITIKLARSTMMAPLREPEKLKEHDFFVYIQNVDNWDLVDDNLKLHSKNEAGAEVTMIFTL